MIVTRVAVLLAPALFTGSLSLLWALPLVDIFSQMTRCYGSRGCVVCQLAFPLPKHRRLARRQAVMLACDERPSLPESTLRGGYRRRSMYGRRPAQVNKVCSREGGAERLWPLAVVEHWKDILKCIQPRRSRRDVELDIEISSPCVLERAGPTRVGFWLLPLATREQRRPLIFPMARGVHSSLERALLFWWSGPVYRHARGTAPQKVASYYIALVSGACVLASLGRVGRFNSSCRLPIVDLLCQRLRNS